jgi:glutamyl-tRNA reductase
MIAEHPGLAPHGVDGEPERPRAATVVALVAHAREVRSLEREAYAAALRALPGHPGRVLVATCHRVELYCAGDAASADLPQPPVGVRRLEDAPAVRHLVEVACGLDSAVLGETQILHQLRETVEAHQGGAGLDPVLDRLFQAAFRAGREARSQLSGSPRSLADVALDRIARRLGRDDPADLGGSTILIVGAGRMGRLAALAAARRGARVRVANRTAAAAAALAADVHGEVACFVASPLDPPPDGIVVALAGPWPISAADAAHLATRRMLVADLSSPPALGTAGQEALGDAYVSVDELALGDAVTIGPRLLARLERIASRAGAGYCEWLRSRDAVPAIRAVVDAAHERRRHEVAWLRQRLPDLSEEDYAVVEQMSHRLVAALLHAPLTALNADADRSLEPAARELFGV